MANPQDLFGPDASAIPFPPRPHSATRGDETAWPPHPATPPGEGAAADSAPADELLYAPVPFEPAGVVQVRCVVGKELQPLPYPVEDE
jgi:hypothetical protein